MPNLEYLALGGFENLTNAHTLFDVLPLLPRLWVLELSHIPLKSSISFQLSDLPDLQVLHLDHTDLMGTLDELFRYDDTSTTLLPIKLWGLYLSHNPNLSGTLPTTIGLLSGLTTVDLAHCGLTGPIPSELGLLPYLDHLRLDHNALNGSFPFHTGERVRSVSLQNNNLTGGLEHVRTFKS